MAMENKNGLTVPNMRENGFLIKLTDKVSSTMQTETSTKDNGKMTRLMAMEHTHMQMGPDILETGETISNTVWEEKLGQMERYMKACTLKERKMGMEN